MMEDFSKVFAYAEKKGCSDLELYISDNDSLSMEIRKGKMDKFESAKSRGVGVRVIRGTRQALVYGTSIESSDLERAVDEAFDIAWHMDEDGDIQIQDGGEGSYEIDKALQGSLAAITTEEKLGFLREIEGQASHEGVLIEATSYSETFYQRTLLNSRGLKKTETGAYCGGSISLAISNGGGNETGYAYHYSRNPQELMGRALGEEAYRKASEMIGAIQVPTGRYPVLFDREVAVSLLGLLAHSFNGENLLKNKSLLQGLEGNPVFSPKVQIIDDGTMDGVLGTSFFDGDGVGISRNVIVRDGVFLKGLYNLSIGAKSGQSTTGNGHRSYSALPGIRHNSLSMSGGTSGREDILLGMSHGLIIKDLMGLHMANPITGEFSLGASGLVIRGGIVAEGFRGVTVSGNLKDLFADIEELADDFAFDATMGASSFFVKDVVISGS